MLREMKQKTKNWEMTVSEVQRRECTNLKYLGKVLLGQVGEVREVEGKAESSCNLKTKE